MHEHGEHDVEGHRINLLGRYSFLLPADLGVGMWLLRDPSTADADEDDEPI